MFFQNIITIIFAKVGHITIIKIMISILTSYAFLVSIFLKNHLIFYLHKFFKITLVLLNDSQKLTSINFNYIR
jgi:hypothetical protein